jgi:hypothetical protein
LAHTGGAGIKSRCTGRGGGTPKQTFKVKLKYPDVRDGITKERKSSLQSQNSSVKYRAFEPVGSCQVKSYSKCRAVVFKTPFG